MGLFKDIRQLTKMGTDLHNNWNPAAQMQAGTAQMQQLQHRMQAQTADLQLEQTGTPGAATIIALADTGTRINDVPMARISLLVEVGGRPPYPVTREVMLPLHAMAQAGVGQRVSVKVDQYDPSRVLIRWGHPLV